MKKGQVTSYIILGFVILIAIVFVISTRSYILGIISNLSERAAVIPPEIVPIQNYISGCLKTISEDGVSLVGANGGSIKQTNSLNYLLVNISYLYYKGNTYVPTADQVSSDLANYVNLNSKLCVQNISKSFVVTSGTINTNVNVKQNEVDFNINWPIKVEKGNLTAQFNTFDFVLPVRLGIILDSTSKIVDQLTVGKICLTCIGRIGMDNDLLISYSQYASNLIFVLSDNKPILDNTNYTFTFAAGFEK